MAISERDISRWAALGALGLLLWVARGVLPPFVVAGIFAYILSPLVDRLAVRFHLRRTHAALGLVVVILALLGLGSWSLSARLNNEVRALRAEGPSIVESMAQRMTGGGTIELVGQRITAADLSDRLSAAVSERFGDPNQALGVARLALEVGLQLLLGILAFVYLMVDGHRLGAFLTRFIPEEHRARLHVVGEEIHLVLGRFLRGQLWLILIMSTVTFAVLEFGFRLPYALWVGILTGVLEIIPLLGPVTAGAIAASIGFAQGGPGEAGALVLTYFVLRQVEDQLVMPFVVGRAVHLHPLATIFAVLVGERVAGVLGMLLAVPFAAAVKVVLDFAYPPVEPAQEAERSGQGIVPQHSTPVPTELPGSEVLRV